MVVTLDNQATRSQARVVVKVTWVLILITMLLWEFNIYYDLPLTSLWVFHAWFSRLDDYVILIVKFIHVDRLTSNLEVEIK